MPPYDAILRNWYSVRHAGVEILYGEIYQDSKGRFKDGDHVRTSPVQAFIGDYASTRNTIYKLEDKLKG